MNTFFSYKYVCEMSLTIFVICLNGWSSTVFGRFSYVEHARGSSLLACSVTSIEVCSVDKKQVNRKMMVDSTDVSFTFDRCPRLTMRNVCSVVWLPHKALGQSKPIFHQVF